MAPAALILLLGLLLHLNYAFFMVKGSSMHPTLKDGELVVVSKDSTFERDQIVFFSRPQGWTGQEAHAVLVKRLVGLPGDKFTYKDGVISINGKRYPMPKSYACSPTSYSTVIKPHEYFFMGDNAPVSLDSRYTFCQGNRAQSFVPERSVITHGKILLGTKE